MKIWITDMTTRFQATYLIIFATAPHQCVVKTNSTSILGSQADKSAPLYWT